MKTQARLSLPLPAPTQWTPIGHCGLTEAILAAAIAKVKRPNERYRTNSAVGGWRTSDVSAAVAAQLVEDHDWKYEEKSNRVSVVSPDRKVRIVFSTGNGFVGKPDNFDGHPLVQVAYPKDWWETHMGAQLMFKGMAAPGDPESEPELWLLIWHRGQHEVRAELSRPLTVNGGLVAKWGARFGLSPVRVGSSTPTPAKLSALQPSQPLTTLRSRPPLAAKSRTSPKRAKPDDDAAKAKVDGQMKRRT